MTPQTIDYAPLADRVRLADYRKYLTKGRVPDLWISLSGIIFCFGGMVSLLSVTRANIPLRNAWFLCLLFVAGLAMIAWSVWSFFHSIKELVLFERFAAANGFVFTTSFSPQEAGSAFQVGSDRHSDHAVSGQYGGREFWFGTHYCTVGSGKSRHTEHIGVLNVRLPRAVPYVIIDGKQNGVRAAQNLDRSQRLELEGDFNKYFTVYCPKDYERDVLYFLTPELMQVLIDMNDKFDIEMLGHELYFYTKSKIKPDAAFLRELFVLIDVLGGEIVENTQRYQDWRVDKKLDIVAPSGMQLKKSIWPAVISIILFVAYVVSSMMG